MKSILKKTAVAAALSLAFAGSAFAQATMSNGSLTVKLDASGNIDTSVIGAAGMNYLGTEYVNWGSPSSFYWLTTDAPAGSYLAHYGSVPLPGSVTSSAGATAATTFSFSDLVVTMLHVLTQPNQYTNTVSITNPFGGALGAVSGVKWSVGFDPDQGIPHGAGFSTTNKITGVGGGAAVTASAPGSAPVTLANTTSAGAFLVKGYVAPGCCSAWDGATVLAGGQGLGYTSVGDQDIALGYDLGTLADGGTVSFGYSYTFATAVPEPETYAMLLAGLGLMGFVIRRRRGQTVA